MGALNGHDQHQLLARFTDNALTGFRVPDAENHLIVFHAAQSGVDRLAKHFPAFAGLCSIHANFVDAVRSDPQLMAGLAAQRCQKGCGIKPG
ncbi:hypothetical protein D3C73_1304570 [compost metagenome]